MYAVDDLQAVEPDELPAAAGITVTVTEESDSMGFPRVEVTGPTPEAVAGYVAANWGLEDREWFTNHVVARIRELPATDPVLVTIRVAVPYDDPSTDEQVGEFILDALIVGLEGTDHPLGAAAVDVVSSERVGD